MATTETSPAPALKQGARRGQQQLRELELDQALVRLRLLARHEGACWT